MNVRTPFAPDAATVAARVAPRVFGLGPDTLAAMSPAVEAEIGAMMAQAARAARHRPGLPECRATSAAQRAGIEARRRERIARQASMIRTALAMHAQGIAYARIGAALGVSGATVGRWVAEARAAGAPVLDGSPAAAARRARNARLIDGRTLAEWHTAGATHADMNRRRGVADSVLARWERDHGRIFPRGRGGRT